MVDLVALRLKNAQRWAAARPTRNFGPVAQRLVSVSAKQRYLAVQARTGVPWWFIAVVHEREASQRWDTQLGQGDPLDRVSIHVPAGRGPFKTWEDGAVDALESCPPYAARNKDWSAGGASTVAEEYNGLGYAMRGLPSPYVWSGTDQYKSGKYIADGVFDPNVIDAQLGCAGLLMAMMTIDASIKLTTPGIASAPAPQPPRVPSPPLAPVQKPSFVASIISAITSIFRRKS